MPHFSPIGWLVTGFIFYFVLMAYVCMFWWVQSYKFPMIDIFSKSILGNKWNWK